VNFVSRDDEPVAIRIRLKVGGCRHAGDHIRSGYVCGQAPAIGRRGLSGLKSRRSRGGLAVTVVLFLRRFRASAQAREIERLPDESHVCWRGWCETDRRFLKGRQGLLRKQGARNLQRVRRFGQKAGRRRKLLRREEFGGCLLHAG
jgi:hypothetical protein